jgi:hypothetical protein
VKGEVFRRQNQNTEAWKAVVAAEAQRKSDAGVVRLYEFHRGENDRWYVAQIKGWRSVPTRSTRCRGAPGTSSLIRSSWPSIRGCPLVR